MAIKRINQEIKTLLGDELYGQLEALLKDKDVVIETAEGFIPKDRFDQINADMKDFKSRYEASAAEIEKMKPLAKGNEELLAKIEASTKELQSTKQQYEQTIAERERNYRINDGLRAAGVRNPKAAYALLDHSKIVLKGEKLDGFEEQIEALRKSEDYLFLPKQNPSPQAAGREANPPANQGNGTGKTTAFEPDDPIAVAMGLVKETKK